MVKEKLWGPSPSQSTHSLDDPQERVLQPQLTFPADEATTIILCSPNSSLTRPALWPAEGGSPNPKIVNTKDRNCNIWLAKRCTNIPRKPAVKENRKHLVIVWLAYYGTVILKKQPSFLKSFCNYPQHNLNIIDQDIITSSSPVFAIVIVKFSITETI